MKDKDKKPLKMTENERARIQAFKNVQERRKEQDKAQIKN